MNNKSHSQLNYDIYSNTQRVINSSDVDNFIESKNKIYLRDDVLQHAPRIVKCNGYSISTNDEEDEEDQEQENVDQIYSNNEQNFDSNYDLKTLNEYDKKNKYNDYSKNLNYQGSIDNNKYFLFIKINNKFFFVIFSKFFFYFFLVFIIMKQHQFLMNIII